MVSVQMLCSINTVWPSILVWYPCFTYKPCRAFRVSHAFTSSQKYSQREGDQMTTEVIGKVLIFSSEETDIWFWLLSSQTGTAEQAMTGIFFPLNFSFCHLTAHCFHSHLTAHCFHSVLKGQIHFFKAVNREI